MCLRLTKQAINYILSLRVFKYVKLESLLYTLRHLCAELVRYFYLCLVFFPECMYFTLKFNNPLLWRRRKLFDGLHPLHVSALHRFMYVFVKDNKDYVIWQCCPFMPKRGILYPTLSSVALVICFFNLKGSDC